MEQIRDRIFTSSWLMVGVLCRRRRLGAAPAWTVPAIQPAAAGPTEATSSTVRLPAKPPADVLEPRWLRKKDKAIYGPYKYGP